MDLHIRVPARQRRKWIASPARMLCSRRGRHAPGHWALELWIDDTDGNGDFGGYCCFDHSDQLLQEGLKNTI